MLGCAQVERQFRLAWADHGDDISRQYAGTGALKSGFTRTGRRSLGGLLDDGAKSAVRYLRNNFADGRRQDALDLLTGTYVPSKGARAHGAGVVLGAGCNECALLTRRVCGPCRQAITLQGAAVPGAALCRGDAVAAVGVRHRLAHGPGAAPLALPLVVLRTLPAG